MFRTLSVYLLLTVILCSACTKRHHQYSHHSTDNNSIVYQMAGMDAEVNGKYDDALKFYDTAINLDHKNYEAYNGRASANDNLKRYKEAINDYNKAIALLPTDSLISATRGDFIQFRAFTKKKQKENEEAEEDFRAAILEYDKYLKNRPKDSRVLEHKASIEEILKDYKSAIIDMTTAVKYAPNFIFYQIHLADLKAKIGDYNTAIQIVNEAFKLNEQPGLLHLSRGNYYYHLKRYKNAIEDYDESLLVDTDNYAAFYYRGLAKLGLNDKNGACNDWNNASVHGYKEADSLIKTNCR